MKAAEGRTVQGAANGVDREPDPARLAAEVYRMLERKLRIDRERVGIGRI